MQESETKEIYNLSLTISRLATRLFTLIAGRIARKRTAWLTGITRKKVLNQRKKKLRLIVINGGDALEKD